MCLHTVLIFFRQHKDVALVNLANVLHRAHFSADAAILAHAALDHTTDLFTSHYTLGNIYAVSAKYHSKSNSLKVVTCKHWVTGFWKCLSFCQMLGEYNHSVLCYEQALQAQPGFEQALRRKHAVLCQQKLEQRLEAQHRWESGRGKKGCSIPGVPQGAVPVFSHISIDSQPKCILEKR